MLTTNSTEEPRDSGLAQPNLLLNTEHTYAESEKFA